MSRRALFWLVGAAGAAGAVLLAVWLPPDDPVYSLCFTRRLLGLPCPGCGMTRAVAHLLHGNLGQALTLHPLVPLAVADAVAGYAAWGLALYGLAPLPSSRLVRRILAAQLALLVALWLGRLASGTLPY